MHRQPSHAQNNGPDQLAINVASLHTEFERLKQVDQAFATEEFLPALLGTIHSGGVCVYDAQGNILSTAKRKRRGEFISPDPALA